MVVINAQILLFRTIKKAYIPSVPTSSSPSFPCNLVGHYWVLLKSYYQQENAQCCTQVRSNPFLVQSRGGWPRSPLCSHFLEMRLVAIVLSFMSSSRMIGLCYKYYPMRSNRLLFKIVIVSERYTRMFLHRNATSYSKQR